jgi:hypothetical protein
VGPAVLELCVLYGLLCGAAVCGAVVRLWLWGCVAGAVWAESVGRCESGPLFDLFAHSRAPRGWLLLWALSVLSTSVGPVLLPVAVLFLWRETPQDLPALHSREHWRRLSQFSQSLC